MGLMKIQLDDYFCSIVIIIRVNPLSTAVQEIILYLVVNCFQGLTGSSDKSQLRTDYTLSSCASGGEKYALNVPHVCVTW